MSFLCLPPPLRHRIYHEAGIPVDRSFNLDPGPRDSLNDWTDFQTCHNLLLTCQTIYDEASSILYSANRFFIRYSNARSLRPLRNLTAHSVSCLTHLTVHVNATRCKEGDTYSRINPIDYCYACDYHDILDIPLKASTREHQAILSEWWSTALYIAAHIKPFSLNLRFVCDVEDLSAARLAVEPLLNTPTLADCRIRLGNKPNPALEDLARMTATQVMGSRLHQPSSPFRILDLPQELRRLILEYTDLVTPLCEVEWNPEEGFYLRYSLNGCAGVYDGWSDCPPSFHPACQFRNCWEDFSFGGCFCHRYHAAFTSKCHCWSPPKALFLVCRALLEEARAVFFMKNRFVVAPSAGCTRPATGIPTRLEGSIFLTNVVPFGALRYLRFLEVVFPPFDDKFLEVAHPTSATPDPGYCRPNKPAYEDWRRTIAHVKEELCLPMLTLRVYMAEYVPEGDEDASPFRGKLTREQGKSILWAYLQLCGPLSGLKGLNQFFAHFAWPWVWIPRVREQGLGEHSKRINEMYEKMAERHVMGDAYDAELSGKGEQRISQWLEQANGILEYM